MPQVCRTCLEEIADVNCIRLNNTSFKIKEELRACLPEVDVELVPNAVMCIYCVNELHSCYDFKQKCLYTEKQIRTQLHSQAAIDLSELKRSSTVEVLNGNGVKMDVVYINEQLGDPDSLKTTEEDVNGSTSNEILNPIDSDDDDDEDDNANASNLVLGLCESAPRKHPPPPSSSDKPTTSSQTKNSVAPAVKQVANSAKKSTTKSAQSIISPNKEITIERITSPSKFSCSECSAVANDIFKYITHVRRSHKEENFIYKCSKCPFQSQLPSALRKHYETHSKNSVSITNTPNASKTKLFKCPHCNFSTLEMKVLNKHIDSHILKCNKCYYVATSRAAYQKHISTHTVKLEADEVVIIDDDEELSCNDCSFIAKGPTQYESHCLQVHDVKFPYICKECGYATAVRMCLTKHLKFHTGKRAFKCTFCSYNCDVLYNLNDHIANRHSKK